jgi:hypothetical protein
MGDEGYAGVYEPLVMSSDTLKELRDKMGLPPVQGKHWIMADLKSGELKWYQSSKRRYTGKRRK